MLDLMCVEKIRNKHGVIIGYKLRDANGKEADFLADAVKDHIRNNRINILNLRLTSDGKLIDRDINKQPVEQKQTVENKPVQPKQTEEIQTAKNKLVIDLDKLAINNVYSSQHFIQGLNPEYIEPTRKLAGRLELNFTEKVDETFDIVITSTKNENSLHAIIINTPSKVSSLTVSVNIMQVYLLNTEVQNLRIDTSSDNQQSYVSIKGCIVSDTALIKNFAHIDMVIATINTLKTNTEIISGSYGYIKNLYASFVKTTNIKELIAVDNLVVYGNKFTTKNKFRYEAVGAKQLELQGEINSLLLINIGNLLMYKNRAGKEVSNLRVEFGKLYNRLRELFNSNFINNDKIKVVINTTNGRIALDMYDSNYCIDIKSKTLIDKAVFSRAHWDLNGKIAQTLTLRGTVSVDSGDKIIVNNLRGCNHNFSATDYNNHFDFIINGDISGDILSTYAYMLMQLCTSNKLTVHVNYGTNAYEIFKRYEAINLKIINEDMIPQRAVKNSLKESIAGIDLLKMSYDKIISESENLRLQIEPVNVPEFCNIDLPDEVIESYKLIVENKVATTIDKQIASILTLLGTLPLDNTPFTKEALAIMKTDSEFKFEVENIFCYEGIAINKIRVAYGDIDDVDSYIVVTNGHKLINMICCSYIRLDMFERKGFKKPLKNDIWGEVMKFDSFTLANFVVKQSFSMSTYNDNTRIGNALLKIMYRTPSFIDMINKEYVRLDYKNEIVKHSLVGTTKRTKENARFCNKNEVVFTLTKIELKPLEDNTVRASKKLQETVLYKVISNYKDIPVDQQNGLIHCSKSSQLWEIANKYIGYNIIKDRYNAYIRRDLLEDIIQLPFFTEISKQAFNHLIEEGYDTKEIKTDNGTVETLDYSSKAVKYTNDKFFKVKELLKITLDYTTEIYLACSTRLDFLYLTVSKLNDQRVHPVEDQLNGSESNKYIFSLISTLLYTTNKWKSDRLMLNEKRARYNMLEIGVDKITGIVYCGWHSFKYGTGGKEISLGTRILFRFCSLQKALQFIRILDEEETKKKLEKMPFIADLIDANHGVYRVLSELQGRNAKDISDYRDYECYGRRLEKYLDMIGYFSMDSNNIPSESEDEAVAEKANDREINSFNSLQWNYFLSRGAIDTANSIKSEQDYIVSTIKVKDTGAIIKEYKDKNSETYTYNINNAWFRSAYTIDELMS